MIATPERYSSHESTSQSKYKGHPYEVTNRVYGKDGVKFFHVTHDGPVHSINEFDIKIHIKLNVNEYVANENFDIVDSDALRNMMCVFAKQHGVEGPEQFALKITKKTLDLYSHVDEVLMYVETYPWQSIRQDSSGNGSIDNYQLHNHAFIFSPTAMRYCEVIMKRNGEYMARICK